MSERSSGQRVDSPTTPQATSWGGTSLRRDRNGSTSRRRCAGWSYEEVAHASDAAGAGLLRPRTGAGRSGHHRHPRSTGVHLHVLGAIKAGLVPVPVAPMLSGSDLHFILTDSEARAMVYDASSLGAMEAAEGTAIECVLRRREGGRGHEDLARCVWQTVGPGTGSNHRGRHRSLVVHVRNDWAPQGRDASTSTPPRGSGRPGEDKCSEMEADDVVLSISRMFFAYGLGNSVYLPAAFGASVVVSEAPAIPVMVRDMMLEQRPSLLFGVPAFFRGFVGLADAELPTSVRAVVSAGEALDVDLFGRFKEATGHPILDGLGSTEALHHVTSNRPDDVVPGSAGRALDGYEVQARDRDGQPLPEGESGELWVRGPTTFAGYWRRPELTGRAFLDDLDAYGGQGSDRRWQGVSRGPPRRSRQARRDLGRPDRDRGRASRSP